MYTLVIVESPAKCKKIESYLGKAYKCIASFGHIRELDIKKGIKCIDIENKYNPLFKQMYSKSKQIATMKEHIQKAREVILATDDDREGEAIAWHICKVFKLPIQTTKRMIFHEITKPAILSAVHSGNILVTTKETLFLLDGVKLLRCV
jgi:DNA topoisomerase-1